MGEIIASAYAQVKPHAPRVIDAQEIVNHLKSAVKVGVCLYFLCLHCCTSHVFLRSCLCNFLLSGMDLVRNLMNACSFVLQSMRRVFLYSVEVTLEKGNDLQRLSKTFPSFTISGTVEFRGKCEGASMKRFSRAAQKAFFYRADYTFLIFIFVCVFCSLDLFWSCRH